MINSQTNPNSTRRNAGFSMIDVLVAILVLATGLLALAALQGAMTRNGADARARSQIAAYSEGLIEQVRSTGYSSVASTAYTISPSSGTAAQKAAATSAQTAAGVSGLSTTVTPAIYNGSGSTFTKAGTGVAAGLTSYVQMDVTTTWTDAIGQARTLAIDTIVDSTQLNQTDPTLINKNFSISGVSGPVVREYNPGLTAGVIPIAVGSSDTAATNPQPEHLGATGSGVSGVTYKILTYAQPDNSNETVIQQNVDTRVITCSCKLGAGITDTTNVFAAAFRPTYWDGSKYASPAATALGYSTTGVNPKPPTTQDAYCDVCCRDRNDPAVSGDDQTLFDPFTSDYQHYYYDSTGTLQPVAATSTASSGVNGGVYLNACRLIRVDGQYRTAVDMQNYFFGLLATTTTGTSPIPDPTAVTTYQTFVTNYLTDSITSLAAGTGPLSTATATSRYAAAGLDSPANIGLTGSTDTRYLHARGLFVDHLETAAVKAIKNAITTCPGTSTQASCVLPLLPFTTINETELANWTPSVTGVIGVTDTKDLTADDPAAPARGVTTEASGAVNNAIANAQAKIGVSNTGVIGNIAAWAVDPDDLANTQTDSQKFTIGGGSSGSGGGTTYYFNIALSLPSSPSSYNWITNTNGNPSPPTVKWNGSIAQLGTAVSDQSTYPYTFQTSVPYTWAWYNISGCTTTGNGKNAVTTCAPNSVSATTATPIAFNLKVQGQDLHTEFNGSDSATASDGHACPSTTALQCFDYPVTGITINGTTQSVTATYSNSATGGTVGGQQTQATMTIPSPLGISSTVSTSPDLVTINFGTPTVTLASGSTCTITTQKIKGVPTTVYTYNNATSCSQ